MAGMSCQKKKGKADLTTVLHIRELPHLHMKLAVWFSFPTTNNKNPMIPSWSLVSIYNYSFNPDQIFTKNFEKLELEICSKIFTCGMIFSEVNSSLPKSLKKNVLSLSLPTTDMSAVRGSSHYSWASWSRGFVYFLANGVCLAECSKQFFNKFWVVFQTDFCVLWVKSCSVRQDGVQKVYCWRSSQIFVWIAEQ